ncbi:hypothetical protein BB561_005495 [Smittium simulii]|uniref:Uncharacterized protein n=1 Tax=Smittium simulii TaxID=133385 RepID=A0A2T9YA53_9FUNG|nr:hypothetical protein BB561_005495 [Smittium simulii]
MHIYWYKISFTGARDSDRENFGFAVKESNIRSIYKRLQVLQLHIYYIKENRSTYTSPHLKESQSTSERKDFQNKDLTENMASNTQEGLYYFTGYQRYRITKHKNLTIPDNLFIIESTKKLYELYIKDLEIDKKVGVTCRLKEISNHTSANNTHLGMIGKLYMKSTSNVNRNSFKPLNSETSFRAQEQSNSKIRYIDINIRLTEPAIQNLKLYRIRIKIWHGSFRGFNVCHCQGVMNYIIRTPTPECCKSLCADILRQYCYAFISKKIWGPNKTVYPTATSFTSNYSDSGPKKRKVTLYEKQGLVPDGMGDQRRAFKN